MAFSTRLTDTGLDVRAQLASNATKVQHSTVANAKAEATATGVNITRDVADANPAVKAELVNASSTANIAEFKFNTALMGFVDKNGTFGGGVEQTTANKNKFLPLLKDSAGNVIAKKFTFYWNGSAYVADSSTGFGLQALQNNTGAHNNGFGYLALRNNTGAYSNGFGYATLQNNTGEHSNGFGMYALQNNTGASSNGFGYQALLNNTGGYSNGFGLQALQNNTGAYSSGFGHATLRYNQKANNTVVGYGAYSAFLDNTAANKTCAYTDVVVATDRVTITAHGFGAADAFINIKYAGSDATVIGGLTAGSIYQVKIIDANTIGFYEGSRGVDITGQGTGTHTFTPQLAYTNTSCLGANTQPNKDNQVVLGNASVDTVKMGGTERTPAAANATGVKGEVCWDAGAIYVCVATDTWKKVAIATW